MVRLQLPDLQSNLYFGFPLISWLLAIYLGSPLMLNGEFPGSLCEMLEGLNWKEEKLLKDKLSWAIWTIQ